MRCPRCQHENRPQAKFCEECATLLARSCTACGAQLRPSAQFCPACAHPVAGPGRAELRFTSPESYTPKHLAERILVSRTALEGERKQVTVLFADLKGSMELLADRDPEEARALLDPVLERMMEAVHRYEGTVNQVMGDGIMALFGAPVAHEDHAVRACFAALRMQESVTRYGDELRRSGTAPVQIRVGLNSGEVVVRSIGSDLHMDYTAVGQTMQLAARMEQIARPGSVLLTAATLALAEGYVQVKLVGTVPVPGGENPVATYELVGEAVSRSRFQVTAARGLTRFVGRESELDHLRQALERARPGHGQVVAVIGEPGVGKSRLFWEFTHSHRLQGWLLLESGSVSYGRATPYLAVIQLLRAYFKIDDRDDQRAIREKVTGKLLTLDEALAPTLPAFLALLDVPVDDPEWRRLEPPQRQQRTLQCLKHLLLRESQAQPVLLVFEDLHWVDSETQLLLDALVDGLPTARILLLVNYRPEYHHTWAGRSFYAQLRMDPLPPESAEELLTALLGDDAGTRPLKRLLIERTEGNPFFLEESARALAETGVVVGERGAYRMARAVPAIQVPATVQAVLAARIDRLAPDEKRLLQSAAVIGKDVPFALLEAIVEERREEQLGSGLAHLQAAEFLYEAKLFPELEYTFKHALTHEVAYGSLLHQRRRSLHARVLDAIERTSGDRRAEHTESLARHAVHGEVWDKAVDYLREAGARAYSRGAIQESLARYEEALALFPQLPVTLDNTAKAIDARLDLHAPLWVLGQIPRLIELHQEAERLARGLADPSRLGRVFYRMGNYSWMQARYADAVRYAEEALDIATRIGASEMRSSAIYVLGVTHQAQGRYREAIDCLTQIVEGPGADHARRRRGFTYVLGCGWLAWCFGTMGDFARAEEYGNRGVQAANAARHPQAEAYACGLRAIGPVYKGEFAEALPWAQAAVELCEAKGLRSWLPTACSTWGWALAWAGRTVDGLSYLERGVTLQQEVGVSTHLSQWHVRWAEGLLLAGNVQDAARVATRGLELAEEFGERGMQAEALHILGMSHAADESMETAATRLDQSRTLATDLGMRPLVARCHLGLGALDRRMGEGHRARVHLTAGATMFRQMGMRFWLEKAEAELERA